MAYELEGYIRVAIYFAGVEFDFTLGNILNFVHMSESTRLGLPMVHLSITDVSGWFTTNSVLGDGTVIKVDITRGSTDNSNNTVTEFRLVSFSESSSPAGKLYQIDGYYNCPTYWAASTSNAITGTSDSVLTKICDATELTLDSIGANDTQTWYPKNEPFYKFAKRVAEHGYVSTSSCMALAASMDGYLYYKDISQMDKEADSFGLYNFTDPNVFTVVSYKPFVASGAFNQLGGYSFDSVEQSMMKDTRVFSSVEFNNNDSGELMVNNTVRDKVAQSRVSFAPVDVGNTHDQYQRAYYQNKRVANFFTSGIYILTEEMTDVSVLSTVEFSVPTEDNNIVTGASVYAGKYRVTSKTIIVRNGKYAEKFELVRRTLNTTVPDSTTGEAKSTALDTPIVFDIQSAANYTPQDPIQLAEGVAPTLPSDLSAQLSSTTSSVNGFASNAANSINGPGATLTTLTSSLTTSMTTLKTSGLQAIAAAKATNAATLASGGGSGGSGGGGTTPPLIDLVALANTYITNINSALSVATPAINLQAGRAVGIGGIQLSLTNGLSTISSSVATGMQQITSQYTKLLNSLADKTVSSAQTAVSNFQSNTTSQLSNVSSNISSASSQLTTGIASAQQALPGVQATATSFNNSLMAAALSP